MGVIVDIEPETRRNRFQFVMPPLLRAQVPPTPTPVSTSACPACPPPPPPPPLPPPPRLVLQVDSNAEVSLDSRSRIPVNVALPGHRPWAGEVSVAQSKELVRFTLTSKPEAIQRWPLYAAGGATVVSAAAMILRWVAADNAQERFDNACAAAVGSCDGFRQSMIESERARGQRDVLAVTTVISGAVFGYLLGWGS